MFKCLVFRGPWSLGTFRDQPARILSLSEASVRDWTEILMRVGTCVCAKSCGAAQTRTPLVVVLIYLLSEQKTLCRSSSSVSVEESKEISPLSIQVTAVSAPALQASCPPLHRVAAQAALPHIAVLDAIRRCLRPSTPPCVAAQAALPALPAVQSHRARSADARSCPLLMRCYGIDLEMSLTATTRSFASTWRPCQVSLSHSCH